MFKFLADLILENLKISWIEEHLEEVYYIKKYIEANHNEATLGGLWYYFQRPKASFEELWKDWKDLSLNKLRQLYQWTQKGREINEKKKDQFIY